MESEFCPCKNSWPELVGEKGEEAARKIEQQNRNVKAIFILEGSPVSKDFSCNRVRVWVNQSGIVTQVPLVG
ncbi:hypothetical protein FEM48_Zijuj09G0052800 [Ziziphus jujuba var. spinosa]|uniref:Proteinase inhibitor n=1 Tax=Ziziphus jujuba var. spinosa TaxID=714518 RepID=A0A978UR37_ZIZJJ|nr:hypothetical protein FEM48_Zijuj09G0052800 [Ziziphus jujuba var. spinosa]